LIKLHPHYINPDKHILKFDIRYSNESDYENEYYETFIECRKCGYIIFLNMKNLKMIIKE